MSDVAAPRSIFRPDVVRRFTERQERPVLPRFIRPRMFLCLWILMGLLAVSTAAAWQVRLPETVSGVARVVAQPDGRLGIVGYVPAGALADLRPGQDVSLRIPGHDERLVSTVEHVERGVVSPAEAAHGTSLDLGAMGPLVIVTASLDAADGGLPSTALAGTTGPIEITTGARRALDLLLPIGRVAIPEKDQHP